MNSANEINPGVEQARAEVFRLASQETPVAAPTVETVSIRADEPRLSERAVGQEGMRLFEARRGVDNAEVVRMVQQVGQLIADYRAGHRAQEAVVPVTTQHDLTLGA